MPERSITLADNRSATADNRSAAADNRSAAIRAQDGVRVPPGLGLRAAAVFFLIEIALLLGLMLVVPTGASADPIKADVSVNTSGGYARLVFRFAEEIDADVRLANGIVVITFKQPVNVAVDRLNANAAGYISAARRDPDGKGLRIALARKVTVNSMVAGERLFLDLLPDTWTAAPPGLPQEVVEELARRARDAERKVRQEHQLAQQKRVAPIRVHVSNQPTFTRYVFDLPDLIAITSNRSKEKLTVVFDAPLKFDLADAKVDLPPIVGSVESEIGDSTTSVSFALIGNVDIRSFREDNSYVVDLGGVDAKAKRKEPMVMRKPGERPDLAADAQVERAPAPAGVEAPETMPAKPVPPAAPAVAAVPRPPASKPAPPSEPAAKPAEAAPPAVKAPAAMAAAMAAAAPAPAAKPEPKMPPARLAAESASEQPKPAAQGAAEAANPGAAPAAAAEAKSGQDKRDDVGEAPPVVHDPNAPVTAELHRQGDNLRLTFPFAAPTPSAIFRRADTLWLVFDANVPIDVAALNADSTQTIHGASVTPSGSGEVVRLKLGRPRLTSLAADGTSWSVIIGDVVLEPSKPLMVMRNSSGPRATAIVPFDDPRLVHRLSDPEIGDTLLVVTAMGPARGLMKTQDFVEFRALSSTHGVVVQPLADDVTVELAADKVVIGRPGGLSLSMGAASSRRASAYRPVIFDSQLWGFDRQSPFQERQVHLIRAAASAPESKRTPPRLDLARFYLSRDMFVEAKAVLDVALGDERPTVDDPTGLVLRAVANVMMGRGDAALKDLANPLVGNQHEAPVWRALAFAMQGKWVEAHESFRNVEVSLGMLPIELQRQALLESVRASIEVNDFADAATQLDQLEALGAGKDMEPAIAVLTGRVAEGLGRREDALAAYRTAATSTDRPSAALGRLHELELRYQLDDLKRTDLISELETLTTVWRGDDTEVEALQLLARLYTEENRYRDAFYVMRTALTAHPNSELTRRIQDEAASTFDALFLAGKGDAMPAIEALSLFYDFRELTPIGRRGDEMIRRLSDRLVSVDLLDQAAELLQHQVDHRLQGAARAQVATRLAVIYLMNRKPDRALAALRGTRMAELSNELRNQRLLVEARALSDVGRHELALEVVADMEGREALRLRSDILWAAHRWGESAEQIELLYGERWSQWQPLDDTERSDILRAGIGYALGDDAIGIERFRGKYAAKMAEGPDAAAFDTATTKVGSTGTDFREVARMVASVDTLDGFLREMRVRYPETGGVIPASKPPVKDPAIAPQSRAEPSDPVPTGTIAALR